MKQNSDLSVLNLLCIFESVDTLYAYEVWPYVVEVILISWGAYSYPWCHFMQWLQK